MEKSEKSYLVFMSFVDCNLQNSWKQLKNKTLNICSEKPLEVIFVMGFLLSTKRLFQVTSEFSEISGELGSS